MINSEWRAALCAGVALTALLGANAASAQQSVEGVVVTGGVSKGLELTASSAGSRLGVPIIETPATIQVITGDTLRERNVINMVQAETQAPGVTSQSTPGNGLGGLAYRGFVGVGSVQTIYDGLQLAVASGTSVFPFDAWNVERIEVMGGPNTVLYGFGGVGGTINVVPRKPSRTASREAQLGYGSFNTFRQAFDATGPLAERWSYRFNISHVTSDGFVDRGDSRSLAASAAIQFDATPTLRFTLFDDYGNIEPQNYWGTPLINGKFVKAIRKKNYEVEDDPIRFLDNWLRLKSEWSPTDKITVTNDLYLMKSYRHWRQLTNYNYVPATGLINRSSYREVFHHETQRGDQLNVAFKGSLFGLKNDVSVGGEFKNITYQPANNTPFSGTSDVDPYNLVPGRFNYGVGTHDQFRTQTNHWAAFAEDRLVLSSKFQLAAGLRFDDMLLRYTDLTVGKPYFDRFANFRKRYKPFSWRVGGVYTPTPTLSIYAHYATGSDHLGNLVSTSFAQKDFGLAKGRQVEVGVKQSFWQGRGEWTVSAYDIVKRNLLAPNPLNPTVSIQIGQQSSQGVEAALSLRFAHGISIQANGTVLEAKFDDFNELVSGVLTSRAGNLPPFAAETAANLFGTWDIVPAIQVRGGVQYVGKRFANNANTFVLPSYTIANLGARWKATDKFSVDVKIENLFDKDYAHTGVNGFSQYILGPPRAAYLTFDLNF